MKKFLNLFKPSLNIEKVPSIIGKQNECLLHDITVLKNIKANEFCNSCELSFCYICS